MNAQLTEYQYQRQLDDLSAHMRELVERAYAKGAREARREAYERLESACDAARAEGMLIGEATGQRGTFVYTLVGICIGIVFAIVGGPVVADFLWGMK